ncbi:MAG TPA: hypothetical protein VHQ65_03430 [Thermoanaerobaculia bacterium]|nr:hypothetical protein [Thermoanaerobaculia bacterium]
MRVTRVTGFVLVLAVAGFAHGSGQTAPLCLPTTNPAVAAGGEAVAGPSGDAEVQFLATSCSVTAKCRRLSSMDTISCTDTTSPFQCAGANANCRQNNPGWVQCNNGTIQTCGECECYGDCAPCSVFQIGEVDDCGCTCTADYCGRQAAVFCPW